MHILPFSIEWATNHLLAAAWCSWPVLSPLLLAKPFDEMALLSLPYLGPDLDTSIALGINATIASCTSGGATGDSGAGISAGCQTIGANDSVTMYIVLRHTTDTGLISDGINASMPASITTSTGTTAAISTGIVIARTIAGITTGITAATTMGGRCRHDRAVTTEGVTTGRRFDVVAVGVRRLSGESVLPLPLLFGNTTGVTDRAHRPFAFGSLLPLRA